MKARITGAVGVQWQPVETAPKPNAITKHIKYSKVLSAASITISGQRDGSYAFCASMLYIAKHTAVLRAAEKMTDISKVLVQTANPKLVAFSNFIADQCGDNTFVNYKKLDLMLIHKLVPHIWVLDFRKGVENGVPIHFSGTYLDAHFGRNITGLTVGDHYRAQDYKKVVEKLYFNVFLQKKIAYAKRRVHFTDDFIDKKNVAESILFPCSSNNVDIDYGIGISEYYFIGTPMEEIYTLI